MGSSSLIPPELTLECSPSSETWVPATTGEFLAGISRIRTSPEKVSKLEDYLRRLEEEMKKIDAFKRELPLCMLLLNDAIATIKEEIIQCNKSSVTDPIMEEFIPLKTRLPEKEDEKIEKINSRDKMNWMSSVQLWNNHPNTDNKKKREEATGDDLFPSGNIMTEGRVFSSVNRCTDLPALSLATPEIKNSKEEIHSSDFSSKSSSSRSGSSSATNDDQSNSKAKHHQQTGRKQRRCWSPELHRRFISALEHLGGPQAATPKQIRELMQVHGLTNDEVKSHLQKYRIHTRRVPPKTNNPIVLGSTLWMSQKQCAKNESSKKSNNSQSSSPQCHLYLASSSRANSVVGGNSIEDDEKSEE